MLALAGRNLWRQRGRGLATVAAVTIVVALIMLLFGVKGGLMNAAYHDVTRLGGHLQVRAGDHRERHDFEARLLSDVAGIVGHVAAVAEAATALPIIELPALAVGDTRSRGITVTGVSQPPGMKEAFAQDHLSVGRLPTTGDLDGIALGTVLARSLQVAIGDPVVLYAPGTMGSGAAQYEVIGLLSRNDPVLEGRTAYLSLEAAQELAAPGRATRIEVHLPDLTRLTDDHLSQDVGAALQARLGDLSVETWRQVEPAMAGMIVALDQMLVFTAVLFFILAGLMVMNTCYLSLMERIREFGIIIALGSTPGRVMGMILTESALLCIVGATVGAALGLGSVTAMAGGVRFPEAMGALDTFGLPPVFYASMSTGEGVFTVLFTVGIGVLATLWPARLAARLAPVEAMRFVP